MLVLVKADIIKDEELSFRAKEGGITNTSGNQVVYCLLSNGAGVAAIRFTCARFHNATDNAQGRLCHEWVDPSCCRIKHHRHVGFVDGFPAPNARAVKGYAIGEAAFINLILVHREVLPDTRRIDEL